MMSLARSFPASSDRISTGRRLCSRALGGGQVVVIGGSVLREARHFVHQIQPATWQTPPVHTDREGGQPVGVVHGCAQTSASWPHPPAGPHATQMRFAILSVGQPRGLGRPSQVAMHCSIVVNRLSLPPQPP